MTPIADTTDQTRTVAGAAQLMALLRGGALAPLQLGGKALLPIVQGGMGVGVSAHRLAGSVAALGAVGTISSVDLRRHHVDLMQRSAGLGVGGRRFDPAGDVSGALRSTAASTEGGKAVMPCFW